MKYRYNVIRSHRKGITISISSKNEITVRCDWEMPSSEINAFIDSKYDWIESVIIKNAVLLARNNEVINYRQIYVNGEVLPLIPSERSYITDDAVYLKRRKDIPSMYISAFAVETENLVRSVAEVTRTLPAKISFKSFKSKWGCCDPSRNITFNFMMFMLPPHLQRYIIIHELCHTICFNHSAAFWKLLEEFEPDYKREKRELEEYSFLMTLY